MPSSSSPPLWSPPPRRAGKALRFDLDGIWSAQRGTYRVLYRINEDKREVVLLRIEHRRDAYRPL
ncbi:type II toxin-antitoxin system RelE/ParE family toxin [Frankia sp. Cj3]|uniref:type II toxin-antitoxin system RelE family toxin n=1 Tax=Frankia sp. Cj3 TaxID=2880976 RepID=UPI0027E19FD9|nr:type II toxin-antitoxin system RelE/ParE family toxin [Frankia sp. Cj3]